jgi:sortase A
MRFEVARPALWRQGFQPLDRGVGRVAGTRIETNLGVSGHRDGFFLGLRNVSTGDCIRLETPGAAYDYEVCTLSVGSPEDVHVLGPTLEPTLTLVTCFPFCALGNAPKRFIVHAVRVGDAPS